MHNFVYSESFIQSRLFLKWMHLKASRKSRYAPYTIIQSKENFYFLCTQYKCNYRLLSLSNSNFHFVNVSSVHAIV